MSGYEQEAVTKLKPVITGELKSKIDNVWNAF